MASLSWSAPRVTPVTFSKDVAEGGSLGNPSVVPEAHVGMMVTSSVKLVRPLGEGGMGAVWVADHQALRTQVVVKFIANDLKNSREATERFSREAAAAAQVKSPHVVQTFDHGVTEDGTPYIVMELLEGQDLGAFLDGHGRCSPELVVQLIAQLARALDRAHERGIVHRDIKPGNVFLCDGGNGDVFVKLLDFGIAKGVDVPRIDSATKTGAMVGSPYYMSPEQILGSRDIDFRSDLWSVGVVAYESLTGKKPFDAETMGGLAIRIHSEPLPLASRANNALSPAVDAWFQRACARAPSERFASGKELAEALAAALGGEMPRSVELPRSSTNPNREGTGASQLAGATTEAGIERPAPSAQTRNRVLAVMGFGAVLGLGTFIVVSAMRGKEGSAIQRPVDVASVHASAPPVTAPASAAPAEPPPVAPASAVVSVSSAQPAPPTTKASGHGQRPSGRPAVSAHPSSSAAPPPAPTGHDIF